MTKQVIDAQNKKLGRVATEIAIVLMGKNTPAFERNTVADVEVEVINASKMDISAVRKEGKTYRTYSGFPGGQKVETLDALIDRKGYEEALKRAVKGMLPDNKLKARMLTRINITA
jgi:large subunit ribosomal protein L13